MNYDDAIAYLYALQKHGIKLGLENTARLLSLLGNPQNSFQSIHVAGTNGKGSTSAMLASMLGAARFRVGLFTSPHLISFTERIKVNGVEIREEEVVELTGEIKDVIERRRKEDASQQTFLPTFFEFVTAMAFLFFKRKGIEWAVVETGMGGRLDATNLLLPRVSVITKISLDHREFLGSTLKDIAAEKAGIIKRGIPVVSSMQDGVAIETVRQKALEKEAPLFLYGRDFTARLRNSDLHGISFGYKGNHSFSDLFVPLCGMHQVENASVAVRAFELVEIGDSLPAAVKRGLAGTVWPGRLELLEMGRDSADILIDGAHNPSASQALADSLRRYYRFSYGKIVLILGIMSDKDTEGIMKPLLPIASEIIFTAPGYERAAAPDKLSEEASALGFSGARIAPTMKEAIDLAKRLGSSESSERSLIVITGSFYTIGEAKIVLGQEGILTRLRE
ncbi:MAG TPA: folylpolyglutamate synthase/dihydrofolate synthase family protein [Thermodesulfovibrionales bacterium]|nr:folylpolyglutamate synthase/dihydrofolate synthase family protein [Thermodesulfovibrionales bacterium]